MLYPSTHEKNAEFKGELTLKVNAVLFRGNRNNYKTDKTLIIITASFILIILISIFVYMIYHQYIFENIDEAFKDYTHAYIYKNKTEIFKKLLTPTIIFHFLIIIFSTSYIGDVIIAVLSFIKFSGITLLICYIYSTFKLTGIEYVLLIIAPGKLLYIFSIIFCIKNSLYIINNIRQKEKTTDTTALAVRFVISLLITVASVLTDSILLTTFSGLFFV